MPGNGSEATSDAAEVPDSREDLAKALEEKSKEAQANYDRWVREVAEGENFKKRMQREKSDSIRFANESLLRDVLPVVDNLEWALDHAADGSDSSVLEGVKLTLKMFRDVLERSGVTPLEVPAGTPFDPSVHEAVGMEAGDSAPNSVLRVQQKGYRYRERLLRPARVVVAAPSGS